jgi:hypothetical protein
MPYHPSAFCDRRRLVIAFFVSIGLAVSSLVVPWSASTASASTPMVSNYTGAGISEPDAITAGPDGALWFTNGANDSIGRITTAGVVTDYTETSGPGMGISDPTAITAGPDGAMWFTNEANNSIGQITTASYPPPTTSVLIPSNGATLSGSTYLDASASNATSVEFRLFGGIYGYAAPVLCTATLTYYGWLCSWNTTTVPNGSYTLLSEAFNSTGSAFSPGVNITVANPGLADLANSSFTATATASPGGGCGIAHLNFDAVYPGSAAVGNVTLHIAGCVSDPVTYVGTFTITTGVGTLSGSAPGTVTEQEVGVDLEQSYQINLSVTTATGSFSGTTGTLLFSAPLNGVDSVAVE